MSTTQNSFKKHLHKIRPKTTSQHGGRKLGDNRIENNQTLSLLVAVVTVWLYGLDVPTTTLGGVTTTLDDVEWCGTDAATLCWWLMGVDTEALCLVNFSVDRLPPDPRLWFLSPQPGVSLCFVLGFTCACDTVLTSGMSSACVSGRDCWDALIKLRVTACVTFVMVRVCVTVTLGIFGTAWAGVVTDGLARGDVFGKLWVCPTTAWGGRAGVRPTTAWGGTGGVRPTTAWGGTAGARPTWQGLQTVVVVRLTDITTPLSAELLDTAAAMVTPGCDELLILKRKSYYHEPFGSSWSRTD